MTTYRSGVMRHWSSPLGIFPFGRAPTKPPCGWPSIAIRSRVHRWQGAGSRLGLIKLEEAMTSRYAVQSSDLLGLPESDAEARMQQRLTRCGQPLTLGRPLHYIFQFLAILRG